MTSPERPRPRPRPAGPPQPDRQPPDGRQHPLGQPPSQQEPYGQQPYGQQPYGQQPYEQVILGGHPRTSIPWSGWFLLGAGALMLIGSVSPWATVHVFGDITVNGTDGDGVLTLIFAVIVAVMGVLIGIGRGRLWTPIVALVFAVLAALTGFVDLGNISGVYDGNQDISNDAVSVGFGLWLVVVAAVVGTVFAVVALVRRN